MAAAVIVAVGWSSIEFGSVRCWFDWLASLTAMPGSVDQVDKGNYAWARLIEDGLGHDVSLLLAVFTPAVAIACIWLGKRRTASDTPDPDRQWQSDAIMITAGCMIYLIAGALVWIHYYMLALPAAIVALRPLDKTESPTTTTLLTRRILPIAAILALTVDKLGVFKAMHTNALIVCLGALVLFALILVDAAGGISRPRPVPAGTGKAGHGAP